MKKQVNTARMVVFPIHTQWYALPLAVVHEVLPILPLSLLPCYQPYLAGILAFRGNLLPVLHVAALLERPILAKCKQNIILVSAMQLGMVGLLVEQGVDIVEPGHCQAQPIPPATPTLLQSVTDATWSYQKYFVFELTIVGLLELFRMKTGGAKAGHTSSVPQSRLDEREEHNYNTTLERK